MTRTRQSDYRTRIAAVQSQRRASARTTSDLGFDPLVDPRHIAHMMRNR